ncbi:probable serine/threonine-protein kinase DDB_G0278509 isoform X1 [Microplitis mediator]|uniref:probable serine/threonine-protein kinase DDB_G0278509 isoform X1 n=1 Tax=Microplitis mediator TaxID=375433 RepID=UPI002553E3BE|nr:probable serine/threonine-protein kinase DDB_G0278509 isoform X1 [Microplitis mediator]
MDVNNLLTNYYGINDQLINNNNNNNNNKLTSYLGNNNEESQPSVSSEPSTNNENLDNLNTQSNLLTSDESEKKKPVKDRVIITDEEIDREIDFEFEKIYISSINDFNDKEKEINVVINDEEGVKSFNTINLGEDRLDTYSEISSTVRIQNGGQRRGFLNGGLSEKRGGRPVRSIERVQRSRLDAGVLRKIPIFNNNFCDLSNNDLNEFPVDLIDRIQNIKMLYLGNNYLEKLPDELFTKLKCLEWLDLRNNKLKSLPRSIKNHRSLETILLQGNEIERLPEELCTLENLKLVNIGDNQCVFPPEEVWRKGFAEVKEFLRKEWNKNHPDEIMQARDKKILPVLSQDMPTKKQDMTKKICLKNSRLRAINYKPSNRYESGKLKLLCSNCVKSLRSKNHSSVVSDLNDSGYHLKVQLTQNKNKNKNKSKSEFLDNYEDTYLSVNNLGHNKKDAAVFTNLDDELKGESIRGNKVTRVEKISLAEEIKRIEDIQVKERVYNVITNDRVVTKLRPMRLNDPNWILGFVKNYLGIDKQYLGSYPTRSQKF